MAPCYSGRDAPCSVALGSHTPHCLCPPSGPAQASRGCPRILSTAPGFTHPHLHHGSVLRMSLPPTPPLLPSPALAQGLSEPLTGLLVSVTVLAKPTFSVDGGSACQGLPLVRSVLLTQGLGRWPPRLLEPGGNLFWGPLVHLYLAEGAKDTYPNLRRAYDLGRHTFAEPTSRVAA